MIVTREHQSTGPTDDGTGGRRLETTAAVLLRYALVTVLLWVGALKFPEYEAR